VTEEGNDFVEGDIGRWFGDGLGVYGENGAVCGRCGPVAHA